MIPILGFINLGNVVILKFKWYITSLQPYTHMFWARTVTKMCLFASKMGIGFGRKWQGWSRDLSMIPKPGFMNLSNKLILTLEYYNTNLQPHIHVFWARTATKLVNFPPKLGLV